MLLFCLNPLRSSLSPLVKHDIPHDPQGSSVLILFVVKVKQSAIKKNRDLTGEGIVASFQCPALCCSPFVLLSCIHFCSASKLQLIRGFCFLWSLLATTSSVPTHYLMTQLYFISAHSFNTFQFKILEKASLKCHLTSELVLE